MFETIFKFFFYIFKYLFIYLLNPNFYIPKILSTIQL